MYYVVFNTYTKSNVTHTQSGVDAIWPDRKTAARHAYNLTAEYRFTHAELPKYKRTWYFREATPEEVIKAKAAGAYGPEYEDIVGTGQSKPDGFRSPLI